MKKTFKFIKLFLLTLLLTFTLGSCNNSSNNTSTNESTSTSTSDKRVATDVFNGITYEVTYGLPYNQKYEVAIYIYNFHELPKNYFTKAENKKNGYTSMHNEENLYSVGGDRFYNKEGHLPTLPTIEYYTECDINYTGGARNAERIVFSSLYNVYYTADHYDTFEQIY